jgi:hypothetical protein
MSSTIDNDTVPIVRAKLDSSSEVKRGRGRPAKYSPEEREQKYKELTKQWRDVHIEECKEKRKTYYNEHSDSLVKQTTGYQMRARNALRLLSELLETNEIEFKSEKYKDLANQLVKEKKIIYA